MEFYTAGKEARPVRLPEHLRQRAWDSLHGVYGDEAWRTRSVSLDDIPGINDRSPLQQYDAAILRIAQQAPLRFCVEESICGAATLGDAIAHLVPATLHGEPLCMSNSHLTLNFHRVVDEGLDSYAAEIAQRLCDPTLDEDQKAFLHSLENVLEAMKIYHERYLDAARTAAPAVYARLQQVPFKGARNFHEAVQSLWFTFSFVRLCGNWPGIGRLDVILGKHLKQDLTNKVLTLDEARCILAEFFIKGCEWIRSDAPAGTGDAQHYQNIVLAGIDETGCEVANEVTDLVLDVVEELPIGDFPITLRINENTPDPLLMHAARVIRHGGGVLAVYNEPLILRAMEKAGYPPEDARCFANDGCWEVQVPGATNFGYIPFDGLQLLDKALSLGETDATPEFGDMESLYNVFLRELKSTVQHFYQTIILNSYHLTSAGWRLNNRALCSVVSLFEDGCIPKARSYYDLGTVYTVRSPHLGGAPDVGNSLYAIQKLVFEEKRVTLAQLVDILNNNWDGQEALRLSVRNRFSFYGNDSEADEWVARVINDFAAIVHSCNIENAPPVKFVPGISTFGRQVDWLPSRCATAFGARKGDILAGNASPTPGTDASGATAIIRSYCKADHTLLTTGSALDIKLNPNTLAGEQGLLSLAALIRGFVQLGGFFMQPDVMDPEILRAAQKDPAAYKTLSVRVSGWNARFVTLNPQWQDMVIQRVAQNI